jgi:hypothetical protein
MVGSGYGQKKDDFHYRMKVRVDPALHKLEAEAWIQQPPSSRFYLHKGLAVRQVMADGKVVAFYQDSSRDPSNYAKLGTPVVVEGEKLQQLHVAYGGEIREIIWECNMITPELVELALYSAWYPMFREMKDFTFELEINMPVGLLTTTNGSQKRQWEQHGRSISIWTSYRSGFDMVLLASPRLHKLEGRGKDIQAEMYYHLLSAQLMKSKMDSLLEGMKRLSDLYGPPQVKGVLRFVYSPRSGQGYQRIPLIVVSEERAQQWMSEEYGEAKDFRHNCHEIAHFWFILADPNTPDDWINEGLAEFHAFRITEELYGKAYADMRIGEYRQNAKESQTADAIAETLSASPDREVNRYDKTTLMFLEAQSRFGQEPLNKVFKALRTRFGGTTQTTTALFLEEVRNQMGKDAEAFFRETLYRKNEVEKPARQTQ